MRIDQLRVENFRNFAASRFEFNPHFTAVIGINGKGKSSILHGLRIAAGAYLLGIPGAPKRHIHPSERRLLPSETGKALVPAEGDVVVEAEGVVENYVGSWRRRLRAGGRQTTASWDDVGAVRTQAEMIAQQINGQGRERVDNLVIAFFGTDRGKVQASKRTPFNFQVGKQILRDGYANWDDLKAGAFNYLTWRAAYPILLAENQEFAGLEEAFNEAIYTAVPYVKAVRFDGQHLWLRVQVEETSYPMLPLALQSDGIQMMVQLVAELAYRCVTLNGHHGAEAVRRSKGLVLIDELDLHLHPNWQRHVVADLKKAFPNIQFVATTHSPFIVQSLAADEVLNLDGPGPDVDPSDLRIDEVAANVMGVESPYSEESAREEAAATEALQHPAPDAADIPISNPALRAILRLEMLARQAERDATD